MTPLIRNFKNQVSFFKMALIFKVVLLGYTKKSIKKELDKKETKPPALALSNIVAGMFSEIHITKFTNPDDNDKAFHLLKTYYKKCNPEDFKTSMYAEQNWIKDFLDRLKFENVFSYDRNAPLEQAEISAQIYSKTVHALRDMSEYFQLDTKQILSYFASYVLFGHIMKPFLAASLVNSAPGLEPLKPWSERDIKDILHFIYAPMRPYHVSFETSAQYLEPTVERCKNRLQQALTSTKENRLQQDSFIFPNEIALFALSLKGQDTWAKAFPSTHNLTNLTGAVNVLKQTDEVLHQQFFLEQNLARPSSHDKPLRNKSKI